MKRSTIFSIDNFYEDERVKACCQSVEKLKKSYDETGHFFTFEPIIKTEIIDDKLILRLAKLSSNIETRKLIVDILDDLHKLALSDDDIDWAINTFRENEDRQKAEVTIYIIDGYKILGSEAIKNARYLKTPIEVLLKNHQKEKNKNLMSSQVVKDAIKKQIPENKEYLLTDVISSMERIFKFYLIDVVVEYLTIQKYYGITQLKGKDKKKWIKLWKFLPNVELE